ncbi:MAG TPA: tyrosine-type recombinase/integrase [Terriglobales bacterium]|nr:tyrosine-type recombinase/integrase [Terriglobales bacterium]
MTTLVREGRDSGDILGGGEAVDARKKNFLNEAEAEAFIQAAKKGRHGARDYLMALMTYRHGLRVSELIGLQVADVDVKSARVFIRRAKGSLSTHQPLEADEIRAVNAYIRQRSSDSSPFLFLSQRGPFTRQAINYLFAQIGKAAGIAVHVHPHMLRHSCGWALANRGYDTRLIQDYLGHRDIRYTQIYTRTSVSRFKGLWKK